MHETTPMCIDCRHFQPLDADQDVGHCLRYAPKPRESIDDRTYYPSWPHVMAEFRCGEFEAKSPVPPVNINK